MPYQKSPVLMRTVVSNTPALVLATRKYLADVILACFNDQPESLAYAERISTASAELLENALKYSPPGTELSLRLTKSKTNLVLKVDNLLCEEADTVLRSVQREIDAVWAEKDAKEAFRKRVLASLLDPKSKAMLGYAKIRMETGGALRARLVSKSRLEVSLSFPLSPRP